MRGSSDTLWGPNFCSRHLMKIKPAVAALSFCLAISAAIAAQKDSSSKSASFSKEVLNQAEWVRDHAADDNKAMEILESLTTEVGPRMAGTAGDARAVQWAQAKFKQLGFDKVWIEPVQFPTWQRGIEVAEILAPFPQPVVITALGNSIATPEGGLQAEVVAFDSLEQMQSANPSRIKDKIVFINRKMTAHRDGHDYGPTVSARGAGPVEAAKMGAVGLIIRSVGTDSDRLPHTGNSRYQDGVPKIPAAALSIPDADLLANMLARKQAVIFKMTLSSKPGPMYTSHNVIGEITGKQKPEEYVLIGGHLDSWDLGTGAVDDGAGCAATMAAAEFLARNKMHLNRSVRVVLFANEEQGLYGGNQYRDRHAKSATKIIAAAEADFGQGPVYKLSSRVKPESLPLVSQMQTVMAPLNIEVGDNNASSGPDLIAMAQEGIAVFALHLDGTDYFDLHHTANDTFDKIEAARLNQTTAAFATFTFMAANAPMGFGSGESYLVERAKKGRTDD